MPTSLPAVPPATTEHRPERIGPFAALAGWVLGVALQLQQRELSQAWVYWVLLLVGLALGRLLWRNWMHNRTAWQRQLLWCVAAALLGMGSTGLRGLAFQSTALQSSLEGRDVLVTGVVTDLPRRNEAGLRFTLAVEAATLGGVRVVLPPRLDVGWYAGGYSMGGEQVALQHQPDEVRAGERWRMVLRLKAPHGSRNPGGFDYELWMWERGVQASTSVRAAATDAGPQRLGQTWTQPVDWLRQTVRERIASQVQQRQFAGLIAALVLGDQNAIERADWDVFRATGIAHLVSISGLHITMFAWGAAWAVAWLWRRSARLCLLLPVPIAALLGGVLLALAYSLFAGWGIPAQRTCLMLACVAVLRLAGVRWPWPQTWMLVCAVVVAADPWALLQAGFWLSFVAVGVLFATDAGTLPKTMDAGLLRRNSHRLLAMWREQWVVTLALAPLTLLFFGQVSLVGLLANALAIPWVTLVLTPLSLLGVAFAPLWNGAVLGMGWLMQVLQWLAAWPWATLALPAAPWGFAAAGVLGGVLLVARLPCTYRLLGLPLLLPVLLWQTPVPAMGQFELLAADVGQGNAVLVRTHDHALLYDAGPRYSLESDAGHRVLVPLLQSMRIRLDMLLISHRDSDHIGGAPAVLTMQPQAALLSSIARDDPLQNLRPARRCEAGQQWEWDGVRFSILHPPAADYARTSKANALSCVLRIQSVGPRPQVALLVGDIESPQEEALLGAGAEAELKADVLLVPHHGSKTSSSAAFLDAVQPRIAWVQSGYRNRYAHPAALVMQRYTERGIAVHDSPHCGAMQWQSDRPGQTLCTRQERLRYWSHRVE